MTPDDEIALVTVPNNGGGMARYRKKPVVIEAIQFTNELAVACLIDQIEPPFGLSVGGHYHAERREVYNAHISVRTMEGTMTAALAFLVAFVP